MIFGRRGPRRRRPSTRDLVPLEAITAGALHFKGGALRVVMECPTLAFGIKGPDEQRALIDGWAALLNSLSHPLEIVIRSRQVDPHAVAPLADASAEAHTSLRDSYQRLLGELADQRRVLDRRFFVVVPCDPAGMRRRTSEGEGLEVLEQRSYWVEAALRRLDLEPRRLSDRELADLLRRTLDPPSSAQPLAPEDPLERALDLVAPSAFEERPGHVALGGRLARTIAVSRYPARLHPGWLATSTPSTPTSTSRCTCTRVRAPRS